MCMMQFLYAFEFIHQLSKYSLNSSHLTGTALDAETVMGDVINWEKANTRSLQVVTSTLK